MSQTMIASVMRKPSPRPTRVAQSSMGSFFGSVGGSQMMSSAGKSAPHDAFGTGLLAFEPVENTPSLFLTLASRPAAFPYARLLALAHALPALCNDLV